MIAVNRVISGTNYGCAVTLVPKVTRNERATALRTFVRLKDHTSKGISYNAKRSVHEYMILLLYGRDPRRAQRPLCIILRSHSTT